MSSGTIAASAYFLTCCRPVFSSSFCYHVELPKFVNYRSEYFIEKQYCDTQNQLPDHNLNFFNCCTDSRGWCLDNAQRRFHFLDIVHGRIPLCGGDSDNAKKPPTKQPQESRTEKDRHIEEKVKIQKEEKVSPKDEPHEKTPKTKPGEESITPFFLEIEEPPEQAYSSQPDQAFGKQFDKSEPSIKSLPVENESTIEAEQKSESVVVSDELVDKLENNLAALEAAFDRFVNKNRDFIQNLIECLNFEKEKQKALEESYNKLKDENDVLQAQNEYLKMVNDKQLGLFKDELDKGISENKDKYKDKIEELELELEAKEDELKQYKQNQNKYQDEVENGSDEIEKLKDDIDELKDKEVKLLKNYVKLLNFLEDMKKSLKNSSDEDKEFPAKRSLNTVTDSSNDLKTVKDVLKSALLNGITNLDVRDLSVLHDAIQELNNHLCHQYNICGKNVSISHMSMVMSIDKYPANMVDYETLSNQSIDRFPSKQKPEKVNKK